MWPVVVVVDQVFVQPPTQLRLVDDEDPVEQFAAERAHHPLADRVRASAASSARPAAAPDPLQPGAESPTPCWPRPGGPARSARPGSADAPSPGCPWPSAAPGPGSSSRSAAARVAAWDRSSGGRPAADASAARSAASPGTLTTATAAAPWTAPPTAAGPDAGVGAGVPAGAAPSARAAAPGFRSPYSPRTG